METCQKPYTTLFNAITDALGAMDQQNYGDAKEILQRAQQRTEEMFMAGEEPES